MDGIGVALLPEVLSGEYNRLRKKWRCNAGEISAHCLRILRSQKLGDVGMVCAKR